MVGLLRQRYGKRYDPSKYASERIATPVKAWRAAYVADTVESYTHFKQVWPTLSWYADQQIKEVKYPPQIRKLVGRFGWIVWGAFAALIVGWLGLCWVLAILPRSG